MAEQIVNEFTVNRPIDEAWPIICDVERIAPCLPGAARNRG
jgi:carbon monoxide dehydrogenase subunit G